MAHLVSAGLPESRRDTLEVLLHASQRETGTPLILQAGGRPGSLSAEIPVHRVHAPFNWGSLSATRIRRILRLQGRRDVPIVHIWDAQDFLWAMSLASEATSLVVEIDAQSDLSRLGRAYAARPAGVRLTFVAQSADAHRRAAVAGIPAETCVIIRGSVDFGLLNRARREEQRASLGLSPGDFGVLVLPPLSRPSGTFVSVWAALLVQKIRPELKLLLPAGGRELRRILSLIRSCRHDFMRRSRASATLPDLLVAADASIFTPAAQADVFGLNWAMAAGSPIVASATRATAELLAHDMNARLCRPEDPKAAARRLLETIEQTEASLRYGALARQQAFAVFSRQRMREQYARLWRNIVSGRPAGEGISDAALVPAQQSA